MTWRALALVAATFTLTISPASPEDPPAPAVDRVGFPKDYQAAFRRLRSTENADARTVVIVYGNLPAAARKDGSYPYGAVIVMETWNALQDGAKKVLLDEGGHFRKDKVTGLHVMRKEHGFGEAYRENRTGEWEYAEYRPDGKYITPPSASAKCANCHLKAGAAKDFVFGGKKS
jgi:hypothetical protein